MKNFRVVAIANEETLGRILALLHENKATLHSVDIITEEEDKEVKKANSGLRAKDVLTLKEGSRTMQALEIITTHVPIGGKLVKGPLLALLKKHGVDISPSGINYTLNRLEKAGFIQKPARGIFINSPKEGVTRPMEQQAEVETLTSIVERVKEMNAGKISEVE